MRLFSSNFPVNGKAELSAEMEKTGDLKPSGSIKLSSWIESEFSRLAKQC